MGLKPGLRVQKCKAARVCHFQATGYTVIEHRANSQRRQGSLTNPSTNREGVDACSLKLELCPALLQPKGSDTLQYPHLHHKSLNIPVWKPFKPKPHLVLVRGAFMGSLRAALCCISSSVLLRAVDRAELSYSSIYPCKLTWK